MKSFNSKAGAAQILLRTPSILAAALVFAGSSWAQWSGTNPIVTTSAVGINTTSPVLDLDVRSQYSKSIAASSAFFGSNDSMYPLGLAIYNSPYGSRWHAGLVGTQYGYDGVDIDINVNDGSGGGMTIQYLGKVGIGTTNPQHLLHVAGDIGAESITVSSTGADYVFAPEYRLRPLSEVADYVKENHHLPDIPSADEMKERGVSLGDMQTKLLAKVEELTLHLIQEDERNNKLEQQNRELQDRVYRLERQPSTAPGIDAVR